MNNCIYTTSREEWRQWLSHNFETEKEMWFIFPMKESGEKSMLYNDAVEEALCFGWIDSTIKHIDKTHRAQRFTPRKPNSVYSRPNIERLIFLDKQGLINAKIYDSVKDIIYAPYIFPEDIMSCIKEDPDTFRIFQSFPEGYKRIRVAYIDAARERPDEFKRRLDSFIAKTKAGKMISGFGGIDKYYV